MTQSLHQGFASSVPGTARALTGRPRSDQSGAIGSAKLALPWRRVVKYATGVALLAVGAVATYQNVIVQTSREAVINARLVSIRAPIDGIVEIAGVTVGKHVRAAATIGRIADPHPDDARLFALRQQAQAAAREHDAVARRIADLERSRQQAEAQAAAYQAGRVRQDEARIAEAQANLGAARARETSAADTTRRDTVLRQRGILSDQAYQQARDALRVAHNETLAAQGRLDALKVDLAAASEGTYLGDNYNDVPSSVQRARELSVQIAQARATLDRLVEERAAAESDLTVERRHLAARSVAQLASPVAGTLWTMNAVSGEYVRKGQDLFAVLDCGSMMVTAAVSDRVYNQARLGDQVRFRVAGTGREYAGTVAEFGLTATGGNFAVSPGEGRHLLAVNVPGLAHSSADRCAVGRTGEIVFEEHEKARGSGIVSRAAAATLHVFRVLRHSLGIA